MTSMLLHPDTNGETPEKSQPSPAGLAVSAGGPATEPPRARPDRRSPRQSGSSHSPIAGLSLAAAARTAPRCWAQTKVVVRQPEERASTTAQAVAESASS